MNGTPVGEKTIEGTEPVEVRVPLASVQNFAERIRVDITFPDVRRPPSKRAPTCARSGWLVEMRLE